VVVVHDFAVLASGRPALVMEWVVGSSLGRLLAAQARPLEEGKVLPWMRQVCEGMLAAAQQGIIHRDLKPSNLLLDAAGNIRVADFGLARGAAVLDELTRSGEVMGTPHYMAPEQAEDPHGVDTRADIYSFGATFYHALTGAPPFSGATAFSVLYKHKTEPLVAPGTRNPVLSRRTGEVLERCLAKAPADRFASFAEVRTALETSAGPGSPWDFSDDPALAAYLERYKSRRDSYLAGSREREKELDIYHFPRGQTLRIVHGDLVRQRVEALVSSDNDYLDMGYGVSEAIRRAAGPSVAEQAGRLAPVRAGRVAVTGAGELPARFIFHAVTIGYVRDQVVGPSRDLIMEIMAGCFYHADSHHVRSIAFPLVGTGAQGFPRDVCLDTMFQCLARLFLRGLTSLQDARIVLFSQPTLWKEAGVRG
jgi:O-acetyl-ADP-ribose deacetylase (regulator of RNase III)